MRFLHTADWHIGKKLHGFDLLAEQKDAFCQIKQIAAAQKVDAIVIAGDLYDRAVASEDSVAVLNKMLKELNLEEKYPLLAISGNHDSAIRLETGSEWYTATEFYLKTKFSDAFEPVTLNDTQFFMLPYFQPQMARNYFQDESLKNLPEIMEKVAAAMVQEFDPTKKHVLIAHFFAAGSSHTDSETMLEVGGLNPVPVDLLEEFDYVALGHLHDKNALKHPFIHYAGSPVKFSTSEAETQKGVWIVDTDPYQAKWIPLKPLNDIHVLENSFAELTDPKLYRAIPADDYVAVRLTDRAVIDDIMNKLRHYYPRIISLSRVNGRESLIADENNGGQVNLDPLELFESFFEKMTDEKPTQLQEQIVQESFEELQKGDTYETN
ncbi:exonuclease SbcCD subunit D [Ligilactobacillus acidipiscis]|uniref:Nuclease SbcCD subunit D n=1 Tax=Ligilactobacillus acidipiscis TaxID=89059 RepID=A0A921K1Q5_9LACO|nr:exonuclease SbcCD subunit D [Ligilactobacillus acidipiscis]WEV56358.1 exonuclease SbcCD subunit D [Ligilactobacillus acidipiscis]HJE98184.1 exonuclease SbcCD subunit D [Ligilactobacillus acidipiscis]